MKRCVTAFSTADRTVAAGTLVEDDDEVMKGREAFFVDVSAEPQAAVIPGTDKVGDNAQDDEGGLPVSTQSGPGAAEAARKQDDEDEPEAKGRRVHTQGSDVEEATQAPGEKRNTKRS